MMRRHCYLAVTVLVAGCGRAPSASAPLTMMALDTSGSAQATHQRMFGEATELIQDMPEGQNLYLFRFDSSPAEVYSQPAPGGADDIADLLNRVLEHRSQTEGTNMAKLIDEMDHRIREVDQPVKVVIFTDCGIEDMAKKDIDGVKTTTAAWESSTNVREVDLIGVRDSYREPLRDMFKLSPEKLQFLE